MPQSDANMLTMVLEKLWWAFAFIFVWMRNQIIENRKATQKVKDSLQAHKLYLSESYVQKDEYREDMREIKGDLKTIISELSKKADR